MASSTHGYVRTIAWLLIGTALGSLAGATYLHHATPKAGSSTEVHYYGQALNGLTSDISTIDRISKNVMFTKSLNIRPGHLKATFNPQSNRLYIIEHGGTNIYSLDPSTLEVKAIIPAGKDLQHGSSFTPDQKYLLAVSRAENSLVFVDTNRDIVAAQVKVGEKPHDVTVGYDGKAYVTNTASKSISIVDLANRKVINDIRIDSEPHMVVAFSRDRFLVVGTDRPYQILKIDLASGSVVGTVSLTGDPHGLALVENRRILFAAIADEGKVAVVDLNKNQLVKEIQTGKHPHSVDLTPDGMYAYVSNSNDATVSILDVEKLNVVSTVKVGSGPHNVVFYLPSNEYAVTLSSNENMSKKELPSANFTCGG